MHQSIKIFIVITFLLILISCSEELVPLEAPPDFTIEAFQVPARLNIGDPREYDISFRVTHPEGVGAIADVTLIFYGSDQTTQLLELPLYDDGGFLNDDHDVIAGDGIFTNHFVSDPGIFPLGDVFMRVKAVDNAQENRQTDFVETKALFNAIPVLLSVNTPDTLYSGSQPLLFSVAVQDSDGIEDVTSVLMRLKRDGIEITSAFLEFQSKSAPDSGIFGAFFDSTFAAERDSLYTSEFQAVDLSDNMSNVWSKPIYLENLPSRIFNVSMRDILQRPSSGIDTMHVKISASDSQGLNDISSVSYTVSLIGGETSAPQEMFDDGDASNGDDIRGDGRYSNIIQIEPQNEPGTYLFEFKAIDKVGNISNIISNTLEVLP